MTYARGAAPYRFQHQPALDPTSTKRWLEDQLRAIQRATEATSEAVAELQQGTSSGKTISLTASGVSAGRYENPVLTVGADGRITTIRNGDDPAKELPTAPAEGLVLTSSAQGPYWADAPTGVPSGGTSGQVLGRSTSGLAWVDLPVPTIPPATPLPSTSDDIAVNSAADGYSLILRGTGVSPGTYMSPILTIDATGRVLSAISTDDSERPPIAFSTNPSVGSARHWRLLVDLGFNGTFDFDLAFMAGGQEVSGTQTRTASIVYETFAAPVEVDAIRVTAVTPAGALIDGSVQFSEDGYLWEPGFDLRRQAAWEAGETRTLTLAPSVPATGVVPGRYKLADVTVAVDGRITAIEAGEIPPTGVMPGTYTNADVTVGADGRVTAIQNGAAGSGGGGQPEFYTSQIWQSPNGSMFEVTMSDEGAFVITAADIISSQDGSGPILAEDGSPISFQ